MRPCDHSPMLAHEIERLEASLDAPASKEGQALAEGIAQQLLALTARSHESERRGAVRGLLALNQHYYRLGELALAAAALESADTLSTDLDGPVRVDVLLRRGEFELLTWDVGAALDHTSAALPI